jgi:hypothetical protein
MVVTVLRSYCRTPSCRRCLSPSYRSSTISPAGAGPINSHTSSYCDLPLCDCSHLDFHSIGISPGLSSGPKGISSRLPATANTRLFAPLPVITRPSVFLVGVRRY